MSWSGWAQSNYLATAGWVTTLIGPRRLEPATSLPTRIEPSVSPTPTLPHAGVPDRQKDPRVGENCSGSTLATTLLANFDRPDYHSALVPCGPDAKLCHSTASLKCPVKCHPKHNPFSLQKREAEFTITSHSTCVNQIQSTGLFFHRGWATVAQDCLVIGLRRIICPPLIIWEKTVQKASVRGCHVSAIFFHPKKRLVKQLIIGSQLPTTIMLSHKIPASQSLRNLVRTFLPHFHSLTHAWMIDPRYPTEQIPPNSYTRSSWLLFHFGLDQFLVLSVHYWYPRLDIIYYDRATMGSLRDLRILGRWDYITCVRVNW